MTAGPLTQEDENIQRRWNVARCQANLASFASAHGVPAPPVQLAARQRMICF